MTAEDPKAKWCTCFLLRRAARQATRLYDRHLEPAGMTLTQYSLLATLSRCKRSLRLKELAEIMGMDHSSLTRTLKPMRNAGWVMSAPNADDARCIGVLATPEGLAKWSEARPLWLAAQEEVRRRLGDTEVAELNRRLDEDSAKLAV